MAKKGNKTEEQFSQVESNMSKSALFIQKNQKQIVIGFGIVVLLVLAFPLLKSAFIPEKDENLQTNNSMMESFNHMMIDSNYHALYGYGESEGFIAISQDNDDINMVYLYTAIAHREIKEYEQALSVIEDFSFTNDKHINSMYYGIKGDCYYGMALINDNDTIKYENLDEAIQWYDLASTKYANGFSTPLYLSRMASVYNIMSKYSKALEIYNRIKIEFPNSQQASNAEQHISEINNR